MAHKLRRVHVEEQAYCVNNFHENVDLETWIWSQIVTSQTGRTKHKWPPYATEWTSPWKFSACAAEWQQRIKITTVRKASSYEPLCHFQAELLPPAINARMWFHWRLLRYNAFQIARVANFQTSLSFYGGITMRKSSVHSALNYSMLLRMLSEQRWNLQYVAVMITNLMFRKILIFHDSTHFMLTWIWCGSEYSYGDF